MSIKISAGCLQLFYSVHKCLQMLSFSSSFFNRAGSCQEEVGLNPLFVKAKGKICSGKKLVTVCFKFA